MRALRGRLRRGFAAVAVIAVAVALLTISLAAPVVSTSTDFSIFNSGWNGTSQLAVHAYASGKLSPTFHLKASGTEITVEQVGLERLQLSPSDDALIVIGPTRGFTAREGTVVGDFVRAGGVLFLADDFGTGNSLLEGMNATSRFSGDLVMDLAFEKQPEFSVCYDLAADPTTTNVTTILLNYPTSLTIDPSRTQVLARTSIASWLDTNGDRLSEWGEPRGPFPVMARERFGAGTILLLSDPSVLINGMAKNLDDGQFASNVIDSLSSGRSAVYFDESHRDFFDPVAVTQRFAGQIPDNAKIALVCLAFVLALWLSTDVVEDSARLLIRRMRGLLFWLVAKIIPARWLGKKPSEPEQIDPKRMAEELAAKHPDWRIGMIRYIMREHERHSEARKPDL